MLKNLPIFKNSRNRESSDIPAFLNYLTMALELKPTLERAVSFAAEQIEGTTGEEIKRKVVHQRMSFKRFDLLNELAAEHEKQSPELKRAVRLIESSVHEGDEKNRQRNLDQAMDMILDGARNQAKEFVGKIHFQVLLVYGMGVLVPLVLVALLPTWSVLGNGFSLIQVAIFYCLVLPLLIYILCQHISSYRPAIVQPTKIPLPKTTVKDMLPAGAVFALVAPIAILRPPAVISGFLILWVIVLTCATFLYTTTHGAYAVRKEVEEMEREFPDALVQMGGYIKEGRPAEEVFGKMARYLKESKLEKIFSQTVVNISVGGLGLRAAVFSDEQGAVTNIPSRMIRGTMLLLIGLVKQSTQTAGKAVLRMSSHLKRLAEVKLEIKNSLKEVISSMRSVAIFFAPLVTATTARIQGILAAQGSDSGLLINSIDPGGLAIALGVYSLILSVLLLNLAVELEHGDDWVVKRMNFAVGLPMTLGVFVGGWFLTGSLLSFLLG